MKWDLGDWRNCFHQNPSSMPDKHTESKMCELAKKERRYDVQWGVVNSGNAICAGIFKRKADAEQFRRERASAYVVVRVVITPLYTQTEKFLSSSPINARAGQAIYRWPPPRDFDMKFVHKLK